MSDEVVNKRKKISYCSCIVVFSLLITLGLLIMLLNLSGLKIHRDGRTVEGMVVSYTLRKVLPFLNIFAVVSVNI